MDALKETFYLFDRDLDGLISAREIYTVIKALGLSITTDELRKMLGGKDEDYMLSFDCFVKLIGEKYKAANPAEDLVQAFKTFDRNNDGTIQSSELKQVLLNLGEKLSEAEIEELIITADPSKTGSIKHADLISLLLGKSRR